MSQHQRLTILLLVTITVAGPSCLMNKLEEGATTVELRERRSGTPITISVERGLHWTHEAWGGPFGFNVLPQFVIWAQRSDDSLVKTLYVTGALGGKVKHGGKTSLGQAFWRQCFPMWSRRVLDAGLSLPGRERPYTDAVTSATPHDSFAVKLELPETGETTYVFVEVNKSADYNRTFTEERSGWVGQPSLVYRAEIPAKGRGKVYALRPVGFGDAAAPAQVNADLSNLDSALTIVGSISLSFEDAVRAPSDLTARQ